MAKKNSQPVKKKVAAPDIKADRDSRTFDFANKYVVFAVIAILCLVIYGQTISFDFVSLDDDSYVFENAGVAGGLSLSSIKWAITAFHSSNWHPLTWISHQIDVSLFGLEAGGHHAVNVLFHIANSLLVFTLLQRLTGAFWRSAVVAALFAVHPAHVESVAWVAERKDVLSTLFWLLATIAYVGFAKADDASRRKRLYVIALLLFAAGLTAKPMLVTLPFTFLLLDFWPLRRTETLSAAVIGKLVVEKLPFFGLAAASAFVTILAQKAGGAVQTLETIPFADRIGNAFAAYAKYVAMLFYPADLGVWYPFENSIGAPVLILSVVFLIAVTAIALWQFRARPYLFTGWLFFLGTLVPVIGLVQVGRQSMADRYTYVPYIGLSIALVWLASEMFERLRVNWTAVAAMAGVVLVLFTFLAARQTSFWKNSETLFTRTLAVTNRNYLVKNNFCRYLERKNRLDEAAAQCLAAIADDPSLPDAYNTLGTVHIKQQRYDEARVSFQKAIEVRPAFALAYANLAIVETNRNDFDAAATAIGKALEVGGEEMRRSSSLLDAYSGIALAAYKQQRYDRAAEFFQKALEITPANLDFQRNLAVSLHLQGRSAEGERILLDAIRKNPNSAEVYNSLGLIYAGQNRREEAKTQFQKALQINPNLAPAQGNLRKLMEQK